MGLKEYTSKRRFATTPEPAPNEGLEEGQLVFVVHKHAARAMHYDLRLELDGVLKSWACPRGPTMDPGLKRLAVMVEDHPLAYRDFEGVIPEGNYGAGSVIIWDRGVYRHPGATSRRESEKLLLAGLAKGDLKFVLHGEKLHGEFALVKTRQDEKSWLLLKKRDGAVQSGDILAENRSVVSGRSLEELLAAAPGTATRQRKLSSIRLREALESEELRPLPVSPMPHGMRPMLATPMAAPFDHPDWLFEVKWDGYRAMAELRGGSVELYSRNLLPLNRTFSPVVEALRLCRFDGILDGELVVVDEQGQPVFDLLQNYGKRSSGHLLYYVFDLLHFEGRDLTGLPLVQRKELLRKILPTGPRLRVSDHVAGEGALFFKAVIAKGLEGIVAKQKQSPYLAGKRSRQWLKIKRQLTQEGVIAGFTAPRGGRRHFGTLVLGLIEGGELVCIGHAGGGFTSEELQALHEKLRPLIRQQCPFPIQPPTNGPTTWVKPELVCEVGFTGWTADGILRHPTFLRLRSDKAAGEVVRENSGKGAEP